MPADSQGGWVLLEVLVALAVLAVALGVLVEAVSSGARASRAGAERSRAILAAQSVLADFAIDPPKEGEHEGRTPDGHAWKARVRRHADNPDGVDGLPSLIELTVSVQTTGRPVVLTTLGLAR